MFCGGICNTVYEQFTYHHTPATPLSVCQLLKYCAYSSLANQINIDSIILILDRNHHIVALCDRYVNEVQNVIFVGFSVKKKVG